MKVMRRPQQEDLVELFEGEFYSIDFLRSAVIHGFDSRYTRIEEIETREAAKKARPVE